MPACNEQCFFEKKLTTGFQKSLVKDKERGPLASVTKNLPGDRRRVYAWNQGTEGGHDLYKASYAEKALH